MVKRNIGRCLPAAVCMIIVTGCTASGRVAPAPVLPTPRAVADLVLPMDAFDLPAPARELVDKARFLLLAGCTGTFGARLERTPYPDHPLPRNALAMGWLDGAQAAKHGYANPPSRMNPGYTGYVVTDDQAAVLDGKKRSFRGRPLPAGGCAGATEAFLGRGTLDLLAGRPARLRVEQDLFILADDAAEAAFRDSRSRGAERAWSACMKAAGLDHPDTSAAIGDPRWAVTAANDELPQVPLSAAELETARADAACRTRTNYHGVRPAALRDAQQKIIAKNRDRLNRIKIINQVQLENARKFLAGEHAAPW
ncbi:hypothetical protein [Nonomuraea fuscirosea]|uniref:hypothetical protein n=1 Tax=Nonomuraea fuscirosea TaxID=1291556 RepID=UPI00340FB924